MASVSSLDQDMRRLRLDRYTPGAANEVRKWIEGILGERLAPGDLMEALRDGVALCKLVNLAVSPGVKYKASRMPFVQMENISQFLKACEMPPLNLPSHDRFLTVDLYDSKDPAQVLQCLAAFSRRANQVNPGAFPSAIGGKTKGSSLSPESTGPGQSPYNPRVVGYTMNSPKSETSPVTTFNPLNKAGYSNTGRTSPTKSNSLSRGGLATGGSVSSWSSRADEGKTAPAWNIHQYGYMGGASQGNQGVAFGARRQITSAGPEVPSLAQKEKRLREKLKQEKRELEENEQRLRAQQEADEARAREDEERRWQEETKRLKEEEDLPKAQEEARMQREDQARRDQEAEERMTASRSRQRTTSDARLNGQFLSAYQAGQKPQLPPPARKLQQQQTAEAQRIAELERQLAEMRQAAAERERQEQAPAYEEPAPNYSNDSTPSKPALPTRPSGNVQTAHEDDWDASERDYLKKAHQDYQSIQAEESAPTKPPRPQQSEPAPTLPSRPLPGPTTYQPNTTRTSRFLSSNPAPETAHAATHLPSEAAHSTTAEVDAENARRLASQRATKAGGWASKSLLEREMERERERQREWEESQRATASAARDVSEGSGPGQSWDVHQYGFTGGDSQNRGGTGIGAGRRQIIGPRAPR
ncbi:calponin [Knufia obscura]|uniref:Calponin n=1 Tax=Knufia obscura TaxID=1635080 RepID=A0ABR0RIN6_9EURO|nr:calponin [Knufia obscura]